MDRSMKLAVLCLLFVSITSAGKNIVSIHPWTLLMSPIPNQSKTFLLDYERVVSEHQSAVVSGGYSGTDSDIELDDFSVKTDATTFTVSAGIKHYFRKQQKGLYLAGRIGVAYSELSMESLDEGDIFAEPDIFEGTGTYYAGLIFLGYQWMWDRIALNIDGGVGYQHIPFKVELEVPGQMDFVISMLNSPVTFDINLALGYSF